MHARSRNVLGVTASKSAHRMKKPHERPSDVMKGGTLGQLIHEEIVLKLKTHSSSYVVLQKIPNVEGRIMRCVLVYV